MLCIRSTSLAFAKRFQSNKSYLNQRRLVERRIPAGVFFAPITGNNKIVWEHRDDDGPNYMKFLKGEFIDLCTESVADLPRHKHIMHNMLAYNLPLFHPAWTYTTELFYKFVAPKEHQTAKNLWKCQILRGCVELKFSSTGVCDDIGDVSDMRWGKPSWKNVGPAGLSAAIYDGMILDNLPYFLVQKHFREDSGYQLLLESILNSSLDHIIGQSLDTTSQHNVKLVAEDVYKDIHIWKTGRYVNMQPIIGIIHGGVHDKELLNKVGKVFIETGAMSQIWDDICDYCSNPTLTGKPCNDFKNTGTTWASATALLHLPEADKKIFKEYYGSSDPEKVEVIRSLYDSIDLAGIFVETMKKRYELCKKLIEDIDHEGIRKACYSTLDWYLGDMSELE